MRLWTGRPVAATIGLERWVRHWRILSRYSPISKISSRNQCCTRAHLAAFAAPLSAGLGVCVVLVGDVGEPIGNLGVVCGRETEAGSAGDLVKDGDPI